MTMLKTLVFTVSLLPLATLLSCQGSGRGSKATPPDVPGPIVTPDVEGPSEPTDGLTDTASTFLKENNLNLEKSWELYQKVDSHLGLKDASRTPVLKAADFTILASRLMGENGASEASIRRLLPLYFEEGSWTKRSYKDQNELAAAIDTLPR